MTEMEWLAQEAGLSADEIKAFEAVNGFTKLKVSLLKVLGLSEQAMKDKVEAENARLAFEKRYQDEFIPEMRKVTTDSLRAQGEAARMKAELDKAREYGIVPEPAAPAVPNPAEPPRAPGSPDPNLISRDDFGRFRQSQSDAIITLQDLSSEHFKLKGEILGGTQELVNEVQRQHTLGNKTFSLRQAWEAKYDVPKLRAEVAQKEKQKEIDAAVAAARKADREAAGANPNLRSGRPSRFSSYKPSDATGGKEPWKAPHSINERNRGWREKAVAKVREFAA